MAHIAVIDVETTGRNRFRNDKVVELAAVVMRTDGIIVDEFETLINPKREVGPTWKHGLLTRDVINAPTFDEIIGDFLSVVGSCVAISGHNFEFDHRFLIDEFKRCGVQFPDIQNQILCTMQLSGGGTLEYNCDRFGIKPDGEFHSARCDAMATARLLNCLSNDFDLSEMPSINWPDVPSMGTKLVTRSNSNIWNPKPPPPFLYNLLETARPHVDGVNDDEAMREYSDLLSQALEDRIIDDNESKALNNLATELDLSAKEIMKVHRDYLFQFARAYWVDEVLTDAEKKDLLRVRDWLGIDNQEFEIILEEAKSEPQAGSSNQPNVKHEFFGKTVYFHGSQSCYLRGNRINKQYAKELAGQNGMVIAKGVTQKLDVLVVADPRSPSDKVSKAKRFGIRVIQARVFWKELGLEVS